MTINELTIILVSGAFLQCFSVFLWIRTHSGSSYPSNKTSLCLVIVSWTFLLNLSANSKLTVETYWRDNGYIGMMFVQRNPFVKGCAWLSDIKLVEGPRNKIKSNTQGMHTLVCHFVGIYANCWPVLHTPILWNKMAAPYQY